LKNLNLFALEEETKAEPGKSWRLTVVWRIETLSSKNVIIDQASKKAITAIPTP
jgi:hypothetical protein